MVAERNRTFAAAIKSDQPVTLRDGVFGAFRSIIIPLIPMLLLDQEQEAVVL